MNDGPVADYSLAIMSGNQHHGHVIQWLYTDGNEVPSPEAAAVLAHLGQVRPERMPLWAAHWLVRGYDGEHLVHLAGLHGDDSREVADVLPDALLDCGARPPDSDEAAAGTVFTLVARRYLEGTADAGRVISVVGSVLAWCFYTESVMDLPLGRLVQIEDEWGETWGRTRDELSAVIRDACEKQLNVPDAADTQINQLGALRRSERTHSVYTPNGGYVSAESPSGPHG